MLYEYATFVVSWLTPTDADRPASKPIFNSFIKN